MKIFSSLAKMFSGESQKVLSKEEIAELLNISPEAYEAFENAYKTQALDPVDLETHDPFGISVKQLPKDEPTLTDSDLKKKLDFIVETTVKEMVAQTPVLKVENNRLVSMRNSIDEISFKPVNPEDLEGIPQELRPQFLGRFMSVQTPQGGAVPALMYMYKEYLRTGDIQFYYRFRQGLDILDLEPLMYEMLKLDPNSISKWLPEITAANTKTEFFKIPDTIVIQVPFTMLQMTRLDYMSLNSTTKRIINEFCKVVFELDEDKEYFIKTGTFSSKFDFRNTHIVGPKEVNEIGEYLTFISNQASLLASPTNTPVIIGASSNNEWTVREYIRDVENNPCIYKGMPLHTEYRVFVDFDTKKVLGVIDYWDRELLKKRFSSGTDANSPHNIHDYLILEKHLYIMDDRFANNKELIHNKVLELIQGCSLFGQWSIDIMQNGEDFYIIDMCIAANSALKEKLTLGTVKEFKENIIPVICSSR